uniref:Uncharacterized protein LOC104248855 n=1 Tax=Nicotiana sylvestris TaxID=4096 RepID=A0A1U7YND2_NICSY|nr:PREDICTED: uncharacterized protein LOC104248855 [Nicotiana sylvestris]
MGVVGDFNVITNAEENKGRRPYKFEEIFDSISCLTDCNLQDAGFLASMYTWNLSKARADFTRYLKFQDNILRQKARIKWLKKGDANTAFFYGIIRNMRKRLHIQKLKDMEGNWVEGSNEIADATLNYFDHLFSADNTIEDSNVLSVGAALPKFFTHACIIMLPKVEAPQIFFDIRPIILCNVSSKIIAKILNARLNKILPKIITQNQSDFVKGRAITKNILLAQELINDIGKPRKEANVVIKLDMAKAYDRVSWPF